MAKKDFNKLMATYDAGQKKEKDFKDKFSPENVNTLKNKPKQKEKVKKKKELPETSIKAIKVNKLFGLDGESINIISEIQSLHFNETSGAHITQSQIVDDALKYYFNSKYK